MTKARSNAVANAAKGDLTVGTGTNLSGIVGVGADGTTIVADSSQATNLRWAGNYAAGKNKIINGAFDNWQRGTSTTLSTGVDTYCADRFLFAAYGSGTAGTCTRQTFTPGAAPLAGLESQFFARLTNFATATAWQFRQRIENVQTFAGQTLTFSFYAKASASIANITVAATQNFGSGGSTAVSFDFANGVTLTTGWTRFSYSYTVPSISGKTIGTGSYFELTFYQGSGATNSSTIDSWGWQAEQGSVATAFQTATGTIQGELAACQRYYFRYTSGGGTGGSFPSGIGFSTTSADLSIPLPVTMRVIPTSVDHSGLRLSDVTAITATTGVTLSSTQSTTGNAYLSVTAASGLVQFRPYFVNLNTSSHLGFSAEL